MGPYFLVPVPHISCFPFATLGLQPEEAKSTVALGICLVVIEEKSLSDGGFHFRHGPSGFHIDIGAGSMTTMHDEGTIVHSFLRCRNEVKIVRLTRPSGVDICIWVEDRF